MGIGGKIGGLLGLWGLLAACGTSTAIPKKAENSTVSSPFYVAAYDPAEGAALPAAVTVSYNKAELNFTSLAAVTHYNLVCGGVTHAASTVTVVAGFSSVTVNLPTINGLASGSTCVLWLSMGLLDADGNPLGGVRSVTYRVP
jgi:hypothetical protein